MALNRLPDRSFYSEATALKDGGRNVIPFVLPRRRGKIPDHSAIQIFCPGGMQDHQQSGGNG